MHVDDTIIRQECVALIGPARGMKDMWCVFEHEIDAQVIYIGACKLRDVFEASQPRNNSDWTAIFATDRLIIVRIVAIFHSQHDAVRTSIKRIKERPTMPRCNLHGYNMYGQTRAILCSNGQEYESQTAAARALSLNQGAISRHMKGELRSVKNLTFTFKGVVK